MSALTLSDPQESKKRLINGPSKYIEPKYINVEFVKHVYMCVCGLKSKTPAYSTFNMEFKTEQVINYD